eukprot:4928380-Amphidinium_carterae.6
MQDALAGHDLRQRMTWIWTENDPRQWTEPLPDSDLLSAQSEVPMSTPIEIVEGQQPSKPIEQPQWKQPQQNYQPQNQTTDPAVYAYGPWQGTKNWGTSSGAEKQDWKTPQQSQNNYWNYNAQWNQYESNATYKDKNAGGAFRVEQATRDI